MTHNDFALTGTQLYSSFIHKSRYARWLPEEGRRENWNETVQRYIDFFKTKFPQFSSEIQELYEPIYNLEVLPSMRALMTAGPALERCSVCQYNCAFLVVDSPRSFDELMYISLSGTGVGFSVERQYINKLPEVSEEMHDTDSTIVVSDSKIGWASAFRELVSLLYAGKVPTWDMRKVRPAGAPLKIFGGRASGPEPLDDLFRFTVSMFKKAKGRKLNSLECHDLCCKIAEIVVVGGVRRSALLGLSNLSDDRMRSAKSGQWWQDNPQRALANNSICYTEKPDFDVFLKEWFALYESKSGERGMFNRVAAKKQAAKTGRRDINHDFGCNPCSEIILRPNSFCNLTEVVIRSTDTEDDLKRKIRYATILGTLQSTITDFKYLRSIWKKNCDEERLLGVSITGIMDHPTLNSVSEEARALLRSMKDTSIEVNKTWADKLGINQSVSISTTKPSGTVSQLANTASGIHPRFSKYYIRRVRADSKDPLCAFMQSAGFPCEVDVMNKANMVFSFPIKAPDNCVTVDDMGALKQLEHWKMIQDEYCEHKPSITVYHTDDEFLEVGAWVWKNFDDISGISFLPKTDHIYKQAPYEAITEEQYNELSAQIPTSIDWDGLALFEQEDHTEGSQTLSCSAGVCEIVDFGSSSKS